jgi:GntR family transcriptional regulator/MocR family aminotransferase
LSELLLALDRSSRVTLHSQIEAQLRESIRSGRLPAGTELPSTRLLAKELGISRGVVVESYAQLQAEGYVSIGQRSKTVVVEGGASKSSEAPEAPTGEVPTLRWDFHPGFPDLDGFPRAGWARALRVAIKDLPGHRLAYGDLRGDVTARRTLAGHLARTRAAIADPERLLIVQGVQHGLRLVCEALRAQGASRIGVEDPSLPTHSLVIRDAGLEPVPIPVDGDGMQVERLEGAKVDAALLTPAHQFPLGSVLAPERRKTVVEWAQRSGGFVIEDDYDAEYRYDREPVGALQGLAPEQVIYAGSTSKILAPGLRVGWLLLPERLYAPTLDRKAYGGGISPIFAQLTLAEFIETETLYRHMRSMRRRYRKRRDAIVKALEEEMPETRPTGIAAGLHVLAMLPPGADENAIEAAARERGVGVHPLGWHRSVPVPEEPGLILGYASQAETAIARGVRELALAFAASRGQWH